VAPFFWPTLYVGQRNHELYGAQISFKGRGILSGACVRPFGQWIRPVTNMQQRCSLSPPLLWSLIMLLLGRISSIAWMWSIATHGARFVVCMFVCQADRCSLRKRLNRSRCRLQAYSCGHTNHVLDEICTLVPHGEYDWMIRLCGDAALCQISWIICF